MDAGLALSSAHGPVRRLLLCVPEHALGHPRYRDAYQALLGSLPPDTRLTLVVHPQIEDRVRAMADGRVVEFVRADEDFSIWAQDHAVVLEGPVLLRSSSFRRRGDEGIAAQVAEATGIELRSSDLVFEGGDVLIGDDFVLVGSDSVEATRTLRSDPDPDATVERFRHELGRNVHAVGCRTRVPPRLTRPIEVDGTERLEIIHDGVGKRQPLFHLDLFVTLAGRSAEGRYRVLVGSPSLADDLLGRSTLPHAMDGLFDEIAEELERMDFDVVRNPLPLTHADGSRDGNAIRLWYFATANNALVQIDAATGDHVWLPTYGHRAWSELAVTDAANRRIWEDLGFTVHELPSFHAFAQKIGALGCIVKVLER